MLAKHLKGETKPHPTEGLLRTVYTLLTVLFLQASCSSVDEPTEIETPPTEEPSAQPAEVQAPVEVVPAEEPAEISADLLQPSRATATAPENFSIKLVTTKGDVVLECNREWAPLGVDRLYNLVKIGFFQDIAIFRVLDGFMAQFGIHGDPRVAGAWRNAKLTDDPMTQSNKRGTMSFATGGPNTRTTQMFINYGDNNRLDGMGFTPVAKVVQGMDVVDSLFSGYGEGFPRGRGPDQGRVQKEGNTYLKADFPKLDRIVRAEIL